MVYSHNESLFSHKRDEMLILAATQMNPENTASERSQTEKAAHGVSRLGKVRGLGKSIGIESRAVVVGGWGRGIQGVTANE